MCGGPDLPEAPDPREQGAAQTGANISTATANAALQNINEYTPQGSVIRKQTGTQEVWDPNLEKNITVPTYSTYQTYSPQEQAIYNAGSANRLGVNALAGTLIDQVGNTLSNGIDYSKMPAGGDASKINLPQYSQFGAGPNLQTSIGNSGPITQNIANAGNIRQTYGSGGAIQRQIDNDTKADTTFGKTAGNIQYKLPGANDFSKDRQKYENALMARMNPQLAQDRNTLEQQLLNQGLQPGSEAYNRAADQASRQRNDARYGAILNAGQEQERMFGMGLQAGNFNNAAQAQDYAQQLGRGSFQQAGQGQNFQQDAARGAFGNAAQSQANQQNAAAANFFNQGQGQRYQQNAADAAFSNAATEQRYNQNMGQAGLFNTNTQQMANNEFQRTAANNQLQDQGFNAQSNLFGLQNTDRQNALQEAYQQYTLPINTVGALMSGGQVQQPQYAGANMPQLPNVDYAGLMQNQFNNQMAGYNAQAAQSNSLIGGAGSLFGTILSKVIPPLSDIRAKTNIVPLGEADGHNIYAFDYRDPADGVGRQIGVMAQEVMQTRPDAVLERADGMLMVDYSKLFGREL